MSDSYLPDNEPRDILWSLEELAARKLSHAPTFRKAAAEILRLRAELDAEKARGNKAYRDGFDDGLAECSIQIAFLRDALKPFADKAHPIEPICPDDAIYGFDITVGDLRAAAAAIRDKNDG